MRIVNEIGRKLAKEFSIDWNKLYIQYDRYAHQIYKLFKDIIYFSSATIYYQEKKAYVTIAVLKIVYVEPMKLI